MAVSLFARCSDPRDIPTTGPGILPGSFFVKSRQSKNLVQIQKYFDCKPRQPMPAAFRPDLKQSPRNLVRGAIMLRFN
jgi:hypothetical protein